MTNLSLCSLSENWLFKECGHQHWLALANYFNLELPKFSEPFTHDKNINVAYAAFISVSLTKANLNCIQENDYFEIATHLDGADRSKFYSIHYIEKDGNTIATVEMVSTLVSRKESGNNQSVFRVNASEKSPSPQPASSKYFTGSNALNNGIDSIDKSRTKQLLNSAKQLKSGTAFTWSGIKLRSTSSETPSQPTYSYQPCPHSDFNGADFLYFANFQRIADQADWYYLNTYDNTNKNTLWLTCDRQISYYKNINLGDTLIVNLIDTHTHKNDKTTRMNITRQSDGETVGPIQLDDSLNNALILNER